LLRAGYTAMRRIHVEIAQGIFSGYIAHSIGSSRRVS
jgi:hypothetical protein